MAIITIRIPAPSINYFRARAEEESCSVNRIFNGYLDCIETMVHSSSGRNIILTNPVEKMGIFEGEVDLSSLPDYKEMRERHQDIDFEGELLKMIEQSRSTYGDTCPEPSRELLEQPIEVWNRRWVVAYIWALMCCDVECSGFPSPEQAMAGVKDSLLWWIFTN